MEQGQIPPQEQEAPPAPGSWPTWQQHPQPQQGWGQTPYGYAPLPPPGYAPIPPPGYAPPPYGYAPPPYMPMPGAWPAGPAHPAQLKAPPDEHPEELPWRLAGWWSRVGAQLLDLLIVWAPLAIALTVPIVLASEARDGSAAETTWLVVTIVLTFVAIGVHLFYAPLLMKRRGRHNGQTWGKQMCGIRVIRASGRPMRFSDAAMRQIVYKSFGGIVASTFVPLFPWILNYLWPTWDEQHRALHDMAADTRVVSA
jgi:uncharacterized RDD family membrane protein YckC